MTDLMNETQAREILERALAAAEAESTVVTLGGSSRCSMRFADNAITQSVARSNVTLSVACAYGRSHGSASSNDLSEESIAAVVERAQAIARVSPPDPEHMPPVTPEEAGAYPEVEAYHDQTANHEPMEKARAVQAAAGKAAARGARLSGAFATGAGFHALANSAGLRAWRRSTHADAHVAALAADGSGWAQQVGEDAGKIDVAAVADRATDIAVRSRNPGEIPPGKTTVILMPAAVAGLIPSMLCDAKATDEERTFLRGKMGARICGENVTLRSDPADPRCPGSPFQSGGLASRTLNWVENGALRNLCASRYWANKHGKDPTGWPANLILDGGNSTLEEMIASTGRGLLVTRFWYIRVVDPMRCLLTGMTRDGLFRIENGRLAGPVKHLRFNESVPEALSRVEALSSPERADDWILAPAIKVRDFTFTSGTRF